jgi:REP element-mobilizing transposase RayT
VGRDHRAIDPEGIYHVNCRGSNRGHIVWDDYDREAFRRELFRVAKKFEWEVYAWCLMPNHHHVVLRTDEERFAEGFQQLNGNHSRRTNRRHGRSDHLFRNRPRAKELAGTAYLITAIAYVLRNPIEAGIVDHAAAWRWSSYRALVGLEAAPAWLRVDDVLQLFGRDVQPARRALERLVHIGHLPVSDTDEMLVPSGRDQ